MKLGGGESQSVSGEFAIIRMLRNIKIRVQGDASVHEGSRVESRLQQWPPAISQFKRSRLRATSSGNASFRFFNSNFAIICLFAYTAHVITCKFTKIVRPWGVFLGKVVIFTIYSRQIIFFTFVMIIFFLFNCLFSLFHYLHDKNGQKYAKSFYTRH